MDYLRLSGQVIGGLDILLHFEDAILLHRRQCSVLATVFSRGVRHISNLINETLRTDQEMMQQKWKWLEPALKELYTTLREGELFIRQCLSSGGKDWWMKAIILYQSTEAIHLHLHNFLWCICVLVDCIELAAEELTGVDDEEETQMRKLLHFKKYDKDWLHPKLFEWQFGKQYLVSQEIKKFSSLWEQDMKGLLGALKSKIMSVELDKKEYRIAEFLCRKLELHDQHGIWQAKFPSCLFMDSWKDLHVKRRIGSRSYGEVKEIIWMGENFAMRHMFTNVEMFVQEISAMSKILHPNLIHAISSFVDKDRNECCLVMELMHKDLRSFINENSSPRKRIPFSLLRAVDFILQVAKGMEYLHAHDIIHGALKSSNVLVKVGPIEGQIHLKISDFGLVKSNLLSSKYLSSQGDIPPCWWRAPEVQNIRPEDEAAAKVYPTKYTDKVDVYSFGMMCYEILTGKVPFDDGRVKSDIAKVKTGERPLIPSTFPRYISSFIKRCWHADPNLRPSFSSICRILRHIKRKLYLVSDPNSAQDLVPSPDLCDIEGSLVKLLPQWGNPEFGYQVANIPLQMFAFRVMEKEKIMKYNAAAAGGGIKSVDKIVAVSAAAGGFKNVDKTVEGAACGGIKSVDQIENDENHESEEAMAISMSNSITKMKVPKSPSYGSSSPLHRPNKIKVLTKKPFIDSRTYRPPGEPKLGALQSRISPDRRRTSAPVPAYYLSS